jgi:hypothetical protein
MFSFFRARWMEGECRWNGGAVGTGVPLEGAGVQTAVTVHALPVDDLTAVVTDAVERPLLVGAGAGVGRACPQTGTPEDHPAGPAGSARP